MVVRKRLAEGLGITRVVEGTEDVAGVIKSSNRPMIGGGTEDAVASVLAGQKMICSMVRMKEEHCRRLTCMLCESQVDTE